MDRIATLSQFVAASPDDPFPLYGLAMEYRKQERLPDAAAHFATLVDRFPEYVASYLMYGGTLAALGRRDEAAAMYQRGIEASAKKGDGHTKNELEAALADLEKSQ